MVSRWTVKGTPYNMLAKTCITHIVHAGASYIGRVHPFVSTFTYLTSSILTPRKSSNPPTLPPPFSHPSSPSHPNTSLSPYQVLFRHGVQVQVGRGLLERLGLVLLIERGGLFRAVVATLLPLALRQPIGVRGAHGSLPLRAG